MLDRLIRRLRAGWPGLLLAGAIGCAEIIVAEGSREALLEAGGAKAAAVPFFRDPLLSRPVLSPSGEQIAAIHSKDGVETVIVRPSRGGEIRPVWGMDKPGWSMRKLGWAAEDHLLLSIEMPHPEAIGVRARASRLMSIPLDGSKWKYLGEDWLHQEYTGAQDNIVDWLWDDPDHVLLGLWEPGNPGVSVFKLNVNSGRKIHAIQYRPSIRRWYADHDGVVRAGTGRRRDGTNYLFYARSSEDEFFDKIVEFNPFEEEGLFFAWFSQDPSIVYVYSDRDTGRDALYTYDLRSGELGPMVFGHPEYDVAGIVAAHEDDRLLAVRYHTERPERYIVDDGWKDEQARIDRALPDTINRVFSFSQDESVAILRAYSDTSPSRYFLYHRAERKLEFLFASYPDINTETLVPTKPVTYMARDGLEISGYLTVPRGVQTTNLPVIVYPHGGPSTRDVWGYDSVAQFFASRGFGVLQPNYRGSTGYGDEFLRSGYQQWGLSMQEDIEDGVHWLIDSGIADPSRIGIYGASYGAYAALMGLVKTPDMFRAGAGFAGVYDIPSMLADDKLYGFDDVNQPTIGHARRDRQRLIETSPARQAGRIQAPVLLAHGTEDWRVHVRQAHMMADALRDAGKPVELYLYDREVHGFDDERNRIDFYGKLAEFFERHLMGKSTSPATASGEPE